MTSPVVPVRLDGVLQHYAWGDVSAIPALLGTTPDGQPVAEYWLGAHPNHPSTVVTTVVTTVGTTVGTALLDDLIASDPAGQLGQWSISQYGPTLPFLLKVLAAAEPLSIQAHPTREQAVEGFAREDALGIAVTAPNRVYRDANHKPELLCALTEFVALCGFRPVEQTAALCESIASPTLLGIAARLRADHAVVALRSVMNQLLSLTEPARTTVVSEVVEHCQTYVAGGSEPFRSEALLCVDLAEKYPGDPGCVVALLLNLVVLQPGEALVLGAGNLHAYIRGVGVELMANSDNVLRGGLTPKHVDSVELLNILDTAPLPNPVAPAEPTGFEGWVTWPTPCSEFRLSRCDLGPGRSVTISVTGPEILLVTSGTVEISTGSASLALAAGQSAWIPAALGSCQLSGDGQVFRATVDLPGSGRAG
jgi:mannose-6-phosphate isomerase